MAPVYAYPEEGVDETCTTMEVTEAERTNVEELQPSPQLLDYYRGRLVDFEHEREELNDRIDAIGVTRAELHQAQWEVTKRSEEVSELQKVIKAHPKNLNIVYA